jgi:hypothetical protein
MHQSQTHDRSTKSANFWRAYMGVWVVLTAASLAYLASFASDPKAQTQVMARFATEFGSDGMMSAATKPEDAEAVAGGRELAAPPQPKDKEAELAGQVDALNQELAGLRKKLEESEQRARSAQTPSIREDTTELTAARPAPYDTGTGVPGGTSTMTTASIPRIVNPSSTTQNAASSPSEPRTNPFDSSSFGTSPYGSRAPTDSSSVIEELKPATTATLPQATGPGTATSTAEPAPTPPATATPQRRKGPNLAISPLRPGRNPPLPTPDANRSAAVSPQAMYTPATARGSVPAAVLNTTARPATTVSPADPTGAPRYASQTAAVPSSGLSSASGFGSATVTPAPSASALSLSSATSVTALRASWLYLTTRHAAPLTGLTPRYVMDDATGTFQLLAGPVANRAQADRLCSDLIVEGVRCGVTTFSGSPL